jgi:hypothetical protein
MYFSLRQSRNEVVSGVALAPKILEPKKSPILIFCRPFSFPTILNDLKTG